VHVTDLAAAHVLAVRQLLKQAGCLAVNLGSDRGCSVKEMLAASRRITGCPIPAELAPRRAGDPAIVLASSALALKLWGWEARHSDVESLVASTWRMYQKTDHA
jgi:UDP-glucose 4-epimerase